MTINAEGTIEIKPDGTMVARDFDVTLEEGEDTGAVYRLVEDRVLAAAKLIAKGRRERG